MHRSRTNGVVACFVLVLIASSLFTERVVAAVTIQHLHANIANPFPFPFIDDESVNAATIPAAVSFALFAAAIVQALGLLALYRVLKRDGVHPLSLALLGLGIVILAGLAVRNPVLTSADVYSYAGYARTSSLQTAYAPIKESLGSDFDTVKRKWGDPLDACSYGPLWVGGVRSSLAHSPSLRDGIMMLRYINLVVFAGLLVALIALRFSSAAIAVVALNPAVYALYVTNAHNDLCAVTAIVLGLVALARKNGTVAFALGCAAGLIKLPLVLVAAVVLSQTRKPGLRTAYAVAMVGVTLLVSLLWGGRAYFRGLFTAGSQHGGLHGMHATLMIATQAFIVVGLSTASFFAFYKRRYVSLGAFTFAGASTWFRPWYFLWGLPYAVAGGERPLTLTAVAFPVFYGLTDPWSSQFVPFHLVTLTLTGLTLAVLWQLVGRFSTARPLR